MLRKNSASSRSVRVGVFGLLTLTAAVIFTSDSAEARRYRHRHYVHHHHSEEARESYSPQFSSIIVDGNSGATLSATSPDGSRHPASLTKIMTLYLLFERLEAGKMKLDTEMSVSEHAADQDPTKLDLQARPDHPRRGRDQGPGHPLGQRRRRCHRRSDRRRRRRFRQADDAQGARARHEPHDLSQRLRPAQRRAGDDRARPGDPRPRHPGSLPALLSLFLDAARSPIAASRSATTITCSATSRASTASRPATPAPPASIS